MDLPARSIRHAGLALLLGAVLSGAAWGQSVDVLAPPAGNTRFLSADADGIQDYVCLPGPGTSAPGWVLLGPQATLSVAVAGRPGVPVGEHLLDTVPGTAVSASPACTEAFDGTHQYCPAWRSAQDGSAVWGSRVASVAAGSGPDCPNAGAIACLLVRSVATRPGPQPLGLFARTSYIQRLRTRGGAAPGGACTVGQRALVPYGATYNFYAPGT